MLELKKTNNEIISIHAFPDNSSLVKFKEKNLGTILFEGTRQELKKKDVNFWKEYLGEEPMHRMPFNFEGVHIMWHYDINACIRAVFFQLEGDHIIIISESQPYNHFINLYARYNYVFK